MFFNINDEFFLELLFFFLVLFFLVFLEIFQWKFGVYWNEVAPNPDDGIDHFSAFEFVLELVVSGWKDLRQQVTQEELTESAAELWRAEQAFKP